MKICLMEEHIVDHLKGIVGEEWVDVEKDRVFQYSLEHTNSSYKLVAPEPVEGSVVVKPITTEEIGKIMALANETKVPVIAKGARTALAANAIPQKPSILVSLERMNKILEVDEENMMITCEAAVTLGDLIQHLSTHPTLHFPLHPGDEGAQVGAMVAMNAGGVRAVRHGVMRDQVRGLEVVLPTGEVVQMGGKEGKLQKDNAGYSLIHLLIGSEGTLGIITRATLKLLPRAGFTGTLIIPYTRRRDAFKTVPQILQAGIIPQAIEYVERDQIHRTAEDMGKHWPVQEGEGDLIMILAEAKEDDFYACAEVIDKICTKQGALDILVAEGGEEQRNILEIRSHVLPAIEKDVVDSPDITVPRGQLDPLLEALDALAARYNTRIPVLAHAGDGNLHTFILKENGSIPPYYEELRDAMYRKTLELGGTITGEHGVGQLRLHLLPMQFSQQELRIMWKIKQAFDPNNILNPGKTILPMDMES